MLASGQHGHFTTAQAHECGYQDSLLSYHTQTGKFVRVHRGVYRLRDYPSSQYEEIVAAWLAIGKEIAVISHESALDLLGLSNVIADKIHFTVSRAQRHVVDLPLVKVHTTTRPIIRSELTIRHGIRLTSATRSIVDAAEWGTDPYQIVLAVQDALQNLLSTPTYLEMAASVRSKRVRDLIHYGVIQAETRTQLA